MVLHKEYFEGLRDAWQQHQATGSGQPNEPAQAQLHGGQGIPGQSSASVPSTAGTDIAQLVEGLRKQHARKIRNNRFAEDRLYGTRGAVPDSENSVYNDELKGATPQGLWRYPVPDTLAKPAAVVGKQTSFSIVDALALPGRRAHQHETHRAFLSRNTAFPDIEDGGRSREGVAPPAPRKTTGEVGPGGEQSLDETAQTATKTERLEDDKRVKDEAALEAHMPIGSEELTRHLLKMPRGGALETASVHAPDKNIDDLIETALAPKATPEGAGLDKMG
mmetsp:Transcript_13227/g.29755  ORF Transcript_13227/g.29755 Transcript_13227/m.29755 type:complete len:277 (-) Transcript_13227:32-862(-)